MTPFAVLLFALPGAQRSEEINLFDDFYGKDYTFYCKSVPFSLKGHKLVPGIDGKRKSTIDGQIEWGDKWDRFNPGSERKRMVLKTLWVRRGREQFEFPAPALFGVFDINYPTRGGEDPPPRWVDRKTGEMSIMLPCGDGGDHYRAIFTIRRDGEFGTRTIFLGSTIGEERTYKLWKHKVHI